MAHLHRDRSVSIATAANYRLTFVMFALILLVVVPVLTGLLIMLAQTKLLGATQDTQVQMAAVRRLYLPVPQTSGKTLKVRKSATRLEMALARLDLEQSGVRSRVENLHRTQLALTAALALLGLLACRFTASTLGGIRRNLEALETLFETASHLSLNAAEATHEYLTRKSRRYSRRNKWCSGAMNPIRACCYPWCPRMG